MTKQSQYFQFGKQVGYIVIANVIILVIGIIQFPVLTKGLGPSLYGALSLVTVTVSLVTPFAQLGFTAGIVRFLSPEKNEGVIREDFYSSCILVLLFSLFLSFGVWVFSNKLAVEVLHDIELARYLRLGPVVILNTALSGIALAYFRMRQQIGLFTFFNLVGNVIRVFFVLGVLLLGYSLGEVIWAIIVSGFVENFTAFSLIFHSLKIKLPKFINMKKYLKWGLPLIPSTILVWILSASDRYMVGYFLGTTATGIYSAGYNIGQYACFAIDPINTVLFPVISKTYDKGKIKETISHLEYSLKYLIMIVIPSAFGLSILANPLILTLSTKEFINGTEIVPWIAFSAVFQVFYRVAFHIVTLEGKTINALWLLGVPSITNIILNLITIPVIGTSGAAISTTISYGLLGALTVILTRRYLKFSLNIGFLVKSIAASAVMTGCIWLLHPQTIPLIIVAIIGGIIVYFSVLILIRGFSRNEVNFFVEFIRDILKKLT